MSNDDLRRLTILIRPDALESLTQECRRLGVSRALVIKMLCREFVQDSEETLKRLKDKRIFKNESE